MKIGDWPYERLADRVAGDGGTRQEAPAAAPVNSPATRAETTARAETFPGDEIMTDQRRSAPFWEAAPVRSCWMCGIRLRADQMVADGGSACLDLRWYCRDTRACTERWTARSARPAAFPQDTAETPETRGEQAAGADAARPVLA